MPIYLTGTDPDGTAYTLSSTPATGGETTVTENADGTFYISSFFDIFTELSVNGGTATSATGGLYGDGTYLLVSGSNPEPATIIIWSLLGTLGISLGWWRRRKAA